MSCDFPKIYHLSNLQSLVTQKLRLGSSVDCINLPSKVNCAAEHERVVFMYLSMYYVAEIQTGDILQEKPTLTVAVRCWMTTWI